jgi:hypothetical protein
VGEMGVRIALAENGEVLIGPFKADNTWRMCLGLLSSIDPVLGIAAKIVSCSPATQDL